MENLLDVTAIPSVNILRNKKSIKKGYGHVCPMHTHVINRHIYNHTYTPQFTCSEETQIINNDCGKCPGNPSIMNNNGIF